MKRLKTLLIIGCLGIMFCVPAFARKVFPANRNSVGLENSYADMASMPQYEDEAQMQADIDSHVLTQVPITCNPKLPDFRRYVRRSTADFMLELDARFHTATGNYLIVDSAVRPVDVQRRVARRNRNAAPATGKKASSHERGSTFDIAKKYFRNGNYWAMRKAQYRLLIAWLAYYQATGRIHVIEERACLHIMVREDYELPTFLRSGTIQERADQEMVSTERSDVAGNSELVCGMEEVYLQPNCWNNF